MPPDLAAKRRSLRIQREAKGACLSLEGLDLEDTWTGQKRLPSRSCHQRQAVCSQAALARTGQPSAISVSAIVSSASSFLPPDERNPGGVGLAEVSLLKRKPELPGRESTAGVPAAQSKS